MLVVALGQCQVCNRHPEQTGSIGSVCKGASIMQLKSQGNSLQIYMIERYINYFYLAVPINPGDDRIG
jgi:hypothetical protein